MRHPGLFPGYIKDVCCDWFTLRPLNFMTEEHLNNRLVPIESSLTNLTNLMNFQVLPRLNTLEGRVDDLTTELNITNKRVNALEIRANITDSRLDNLENSLTNMNIRLGDVESEINNYVRPQISMLENLVGEHGVQIANLE
jgi:chromosome segregation ATPase